MPKPKDVSFSTINCNASTQIEENLIDGRFNKCTKLLSSSKIYKVLFHIDCEIIMLQLQI